MDHKATFSLKNGSTRNIGDAPTKILGKFVAISAREAKSAASSKFEKKVLQRVDERPIRGEFKVWIWKNYLNYPLPTLPPDG